MGHKFTEEQINILKNNPKVKFVSENKLVLTFEFKEELYQNWKLKPTNSTIRKLLISNGIDIKILSNYYIKDITKNFRDSGKPTIGKNKILCHDSVNFRVDKNYDEYLILTGKFEKRKRGIRFTEQFINEIYHNYPNTSIEDLLINYDIDPEKVGYLRIYNLKQRLERNTNEQERMMNDEKFINKYRLHPYVSRCSSKQFSLKSQFYNEALVFKDLHIDDVLRIFEIEYKELSIIMKNRIKHKLSHWEKDNDDESIDQLNETYMQIQRNKTEALFNIINADFEKVKQKISNSSCHEKKAICLWIQLFPHDLYDFTIRKILNKVGISKSQYYFILSHDEYGHKENQDDFDVEFIKQVLKSEQYPMGHRMVYMKMKEITGVQFGKNKVLRLMRKYQLLSPIRKPSISRVQMKKQLEEHKKTNLLKREFRLHKPYEVILTDVSYIKYGINQTAYLSALKDSVSGRIYSMDISDSNDLSLVETSLNQLNEFEIKDSIFHSDQGALYLNDSFQDKVNDMGLKQSMSKRGNCWDNAPQESFFGHFKDECKDLIRQCTTIEELKVVIDDYMIYYNERRPQWTRNKMTPMEYENYLLSMNEEEYNQYLDKERQKYDKMMERAKEKAVARATDIGAFGG